jgi:uncharacterized protein (DUF1778 family)
MAITDWEHKKERLEARLTAEQKRHIEQAAGIRGTSVSDFVILSAEEAALRTIREQETLVLNERARKVFAAALLNPPPPGTRLRAAARRYRKDLRKLPSNPRKSEGRHILIGAMRYLAQCDPLGNRNAIEFLSEHLRNRFPLPSALIETE